MHHLTELAQDKYVKIFKCWSKIKINIYAKIKNSNNNVKKKHIHINKFTFRLSESKRKQLWAAWFLLITILFCS